MGAVFGDRFSDSETSKWSNRPDEFTRFKLMRKLKSDSAYQVAIGEALPVIVTLKEYNQLVLSNDGYDYMIVNPD